MFNSFKKNSLKSNPFFVSSWTVDDVIPFDKIKTEHFRPAMKEAIRQAKSNLEKIKSNPEAPNFDNTILALETADELLREVVSAFGILKSAEAGKELDKLGEKVIGPMCAKYGNDVYLDNKLFARVNAVYTRRNESGLNPEQIRLAELSLEAFLRHGILLDEKSKKKLRVIDKELARLEAKFAANRKNSRSAFELLISDKNELKGLPDGALERAAAEAKERKKPDGSYLFTLDFPSILPIMQYADNRELRETISKALRSVAFGGKYDNRKVVIEIVRLRHEKAKLLGCNTHAQYVLSDRMAENPQTVWDFLDRLLSYSKPAAMKDLESLTVLSRESGGPDKLESWDTAYYSEKLKKKQFHFDSEELRPYLKLENVIKGVFLVAEKLYGLKFYPILAPVYHKDVNVYRVTNEKGEYFGLFYTDFFPRKTKKAGAWMSEIRTQGYCKGEVRPAHVGIFCNFTKSTADKPSLLSLGEVETLFHEFGHALHGLLSECIYRSIAGTNVKWDFVELPSQIMENWVKEKECLDLFAVHYETGEKIPDELLAKIKQAKAFMSGMFAVRQLSLGYLDMGWHDCPNPGLIDDVSAFEREAMAKAEILPVMEDTCYSCSFEHLFGGGYDAGYYSYKWAEVLEADAFGLFKQEGLFNREVAESFRKNVLSRGNTEPPMELYKRFRGREPNVGALLRRDELKK